MWNGRRTSASDSTMRPGEKRYTAFALTDLFDATAQHYELKFTCRGCHRATVFVAAAVWALFDRKGWRDNLRDIPAHFRCRVCDRRNPILELVNEKPTETTLPLPSQERWKREQRRRR